MEVTLKMQLLFVCHNLLILMNVTVFPALVWFPGLQEWHKLLASQTKLGGFIQPDSDVESIQSGCCFSLSPGWGDITVSSCAYRGCFCDRGERETLWTVLHEPAQLASGRYRFIEYFWIKDSIPGGDDDESVGYCLITGSNYYFVRYYPPEEWNPHLHCCENMKTHISGLFFGLECV